MDVALAADTERERTIDSAHSVERSWYNDIDVATIGVSAINLTAIDATTIGVTTLQNLFCW